MKRKSTFATLGLAALLSSGIVIAGDDKKEAAPAVAIATETAVLAAIDKPAPGFTLTDVNGKKHSLADFKGKTVVLEWTNYDCPFVKKFYGSNTMQKIQDAYTKKGVVWLSVCSSAPSKEGYFETAALKTRMSDAKAAPTAYLVDADGTVGKMYGAKTTPHMFVIGAEGNLVYAGGIDDKKSVDPADIATAKNYVVAALDAVIAGKAVETKTSAPYGCGVKY
ncbi:MAG: thioredoxin family protein [candidate division Zixibacteria bacterium]|nr:thioredoxin family protein [candidate division Zixibacteria bacterium]